MRAGRERLVYGMPWHLGDRSCGLAELCRWPKLRFDIRILADNVDRDMNHRSCIQFETVGVHYESMRTSSAPSRYVLDPMVQAGESA
jgi:hypothetical protein